MCKTKDIKEDHSKYFMRYDIRIKFGIWSGFYIFVIHSVVLHHYKMGAIANGDVGYEKIS